MKLFLFLLFTFLGSSSFAQLNNCKIITQTEFSATTTSMLGLTTRAVRRCLIIQNKSGGSSIYLKFNQQPSATTGVEGLVVSAGTMWAPNLIPMNAIFIRGSAGGVSTLILSGE